MNIFMPTDFSDASVKALEFLKSLSKDSEIRVHLMHVSAENLEEEILFNRDEWIDSKISLEHFQADFKPSLDRLLNRFLFISNIICVTGNTEDRIYEFVNSGKYDLIISPSSGVDNFSDLFTGTITQNLIHKSNIPVISLMKDYRISKGNTILFVNEFDTSASLDLSFIRQIHKTMNLDLQFLKIHHGSIENEDEEFKKMKDFAVKHNLNPGDYLIRQSRTVDEGLHEFLEIEDILLLAMATHARHGIAHFFLGSITEDLIERVHVPILTFRMHSS